MPEFTTELVECGPSSAENASRIIAAGQNWLFQVDPRFHQVLTVHHDRAAARVQRYLEDLKLNAPQSVIRAVRIHLNDYFKEPGIGLMNLEIQPVENEEYSGRRKQVLLLPDESKSPTLGLIPEALVKIFGARLVKFAQTEGGEEVEALTDLWARGYLQGENPPVEYAITPLKSGTKVIVPPNSAIGLRMGVPNLTQLASRSLSSEVIMRDEWSRPEDPREELVGQMFWCRKLKMDKGRDAR